MSASLKESLLSVVAGITFSFLALAILYYFSMAGQCQQQAKIRGTFVFEKTLNECYDVRNWK